MAHTTEKDKRQSAMLTDVVPFSADEDEELKLDAPDTRGGLMTREKTHEMETRKLAKLPTERNSVDSQDESEEEDEGRVGTVQRGII